MRLHLWLLLLAMAPISTDLAEAVTHLQHEKESLATVDSHRQQRPAQRSEPECPLLAHACHCPVQNAPVRIVAQDPSPLTLPGRRPFPLYLRLSPQNYLQPQQPPPIA